MNLTIPPDIGRLASLLGSAEGSQRREALVAIGEDWSNLLATARQGKLIPALHQVLSSDSQGVPGSVLETLTRAATEQALLAVRQSRHLIRILALLREAGIPALSYKGPTLAQLAFGSLGARPFTDLDILVHPSDFARAYQTLLADGFRCHYPATTRCMLKQAYELCMVDAERQITVDLHRSFFCNGMSFNLNLETCCDFQVRVLGQAVPTLLPEELLLLLCVHGSKHGWRELRWIYDIHGLLQRQTIDWNDLRRKAEANGAVRAVTLSLELARTLFGTEYPELFRCDRATERLLEMSVGWFGRDRLPIGQSHLYQWWLADRHWQRLRYLAWTLFFPHELDLLFCDLPTRLWPLYYAIRPCRVLYERVRGRHGWPAWQTSRRE